MDVFLDKIQFYKIIIVLSLITNQLYCQFTNPDKSELYGKWVITNQINDPRILHDTIEFKKKKKN